MKRIYFDYASTTPIDPLVLKAMLPYFNSSPSTQFGKGGFGNPGSLHSYGQEAMASLDASREKISKIISASPINGFQEIIFTGSATEANNLALRGIIKNIPLNITRPRIIISSIEHESILATCRDLEKENIEIISLPVNKYGFLNLKNLKEALNEQTILVSIIYANNEIGTIQNISKIAEIISDFKKQVTNRPSQSIKNNDLQFALSSLPLFHIDAAQAFQFLNCNVNNLNVDLMTLSAHKIYGPKGIGALYVRKQLTNNCKLQPLITGGGQEFGLRSGTENVAFITGFAKAIELADLNKIKETKKIHELSHYFWKELKKIYSSAEINGLPIKKRNLQNTLPNILNIYFPNHSSEDLLTQFDLNGIAISSGATCSARSAKSSYVLKALGFPEKRIKSSLRFSFGKFTTQSEINTSLKILKKILKF